ncbi:MAG TPA: LPXTG cell wall anchor domain-containing protein, partial [Candidatus Acidoferrales bacterium]|nr:LPXTG cell wall anchor domain-containing protein [Candidatus Acidoferrales bacterium]
MRLRKWTPAFVRSLLPRDPYQFVYLAGVVAIVIGNRCRWYAPDTIRRITTLAQTNETGAFWSALIGIGQLLLVAAGIAGYYVCFWSGRRPARRILCWVIAPASLGIVAFCTAFGLRILDYRASVLESLGGVLYRNLRNWLALLRGLGPAF